MSVYLRMWNAEFDQLGTVYCLKVSEQWKKWVLLSSANTFTFRGKELYEIMHHHMGMDLNKDDDDINIEIEKELNALTEQDLEDADEDENEPVESDDTIINQEV